MNYILVVDDEQDICEIFEMVLRRAFPLDIFLADSGNNALALIKERGLPTIIISDYRMKDGDGYSLYQAIKENNWNIPFVICSSDTESTLKSKFHDIYGFIEKPKIIDPALRLVEAVLSLTINNPIYVPIRISLLLRLGNASFDIFMKLSDARYVKVINAGEAFIPSDANRFYQKGLEHLHILSTDADRYLESFEQSLLMVMNTTTQDSKLTLASFESIESVERIAFSLGWTPDVISAAKHAVNLAIKAVSSQPNILKLLQQKLKNTESEYSNHVGLLAMLTCGFCHQLGWVNESTQMKLGLASFMHDIVVDEKKYEDIMLWNQAAADSNDRSPEALKYRNHPADAANLLLSIKDLPADVDQIILQHHEMKDGSGFPRGLDSSRISPMAIVFIIVEDLINFLADAQDFDERIDLYVKHRSGRYDSGNFKKVFDVLKETAEKKRQSL